MSKNSHSYAKANGNYKSNTFKKLRRIDFQCNHIQIFLKNTLDHKSASLMWPKCKETTCIANAHTHATESRLRVSDGE